jgi:hypothetical protein
VRDAVALPVGVAEGGAVFLALLLLLLLLLLPNRDMDAVPHAFAPALCVGVGVLLTMALGVLVGVPVLEGEGVAVGVPVHEVEGVVEGGGEVGGGAG